MQTMGGPKGVVFEQPERLPSDVTLLRKGLGVAVMGVSAVVGLIGFEQAMENQQPGYAILAIAGLMGVARGNDIRKGK